MRRLTIGSLFSGIGGLELGLEWAGLGPVLWQVEKDPYCLKVLEKHWPDVRRYEDVSTVGSENLERVDLICGGFPCTDISLAGSGAGLVDGAQSGLWFEFARIIRELRPGFVVVENVPALLTRGMDIVLGQLAALGFDAWWDCIPASAVGAPHRRDRVFIVAYARSKRLEGEREGGPERRPIRRVCGKSAGLYTLSMLRELYVCNTLAFTRVGMQLPSSRGGDRRFEYGPLFGSEWWAPFSGPIRVADGVPARVDRLRALGNAVVPQCAQVIGEIVKELAHA